MKLSSDGEYILCDEDHCTNHIKNHRWGMTKAEGWFFSHQQDKAFCPDHIPDWVEAWRKKREAQKNA